MHRHVLATRHPVRARCGAALLVLAMVLAGAGACCAESRALDPLHAVGAHRGADAVLPMVFAATGSTITARIFPLAVTLPSGEVLALGGVDADSNPITACECWHPGSGLWTATAAMAGGHAGGACALLPSGHVLVVGQTEFSELYDPAMQSWSPAGTLTGVATALCVLSDGEVLAAIAGGQAARWSEASGVWLSTAAMPTAVSGAGLVALPDGHALAFGGTIVSELVVETSDCSLFDPATGSWQPTASMNLARNGAQGQLVGAGTVLVIGGFVDGAQPVAGCELYDIANGSWTMPTQASLPIAPGGQSAALASGQVLMTGGDAGSISAQAALYDPVAGAWSVISHLNVPAVDHACVALQDGGALVIDGLATVQGVGQISALCQRYQAQTINQAPVFALGPDQTIAENAPAVSIPQWATGIDPGPLFGETVAFQARAAQTTLFSVQPDIAADGTLSFTVAPDVSGETTVSVVAQNSGGTAEGGSDTSAAQTFIITVRFVNQPPVWTPGPAITVQEDAGSVTIPQWAGGISPGPANQADETVAFTTTTDHPDYFLVQPALAADGTFTCTLQPGRFGVATITAVLSNSGGTADGGADAAAPVAFTLIIAQVVQPPSVAALTLHDLPGYTVSAPVVLDDPDQLLGVDPLISYQVTGISHYGQLGISASGMATLVASAVGTEAVAITLTVGLTVLQGSITVAVTDPSMPRPLIESVPVAEWGSVGSPWSYDVSVSPASLAADAELGISIQSASANLAGATCTQVSGNQFHIAVAALDQSDGPLQSLMVVVFDSTSQTADLQIILVVVVPPSGIG